MIQAWVLLAEGFEEVEAITPIDFLRRAGIEVTTVAVGPRRVSGSHTITITADAVLETLVAGQTNRRAVDNPDAVLLPGGMPGASNLAASQQVMALLKRMFAANKLVAAICAAPAVLLGAGGFLRGRSFTCYPGYEDRVHQATFRPERVVRDANLITSRGPGSAAEFACAIIEYLIDRRTAEQIWNQTIQAHSLPAYSLPAYPLPAQSAAAAPA